MNKLPNIGGTRGIFEIFIPGLFLLLNIVAFFAIIFHNTFKIDINLSGLTDKTLIAVLLIIGFGYLLGVILRLFRAERADKASMWLIRILHGALFKKDDMSKKFAFEDFPYIQWLNFTFKERLSKEIYTFFKDYWLDYNNKTYFNFIKTIISVEDEKTSSEIYAQESLSRYISSMFYALLFSIIFIIILLLYIDINSINNFDISILWSFLILYIFLTIGILSNYRFIRIKEVHIVIALSYKHKYSILEINKNKIPD